MTRPEESSSTAVRGRGLALDRPTALVGLLLTVATADAFAVGPPNAIVPGGGEPGTVAPLVDRVKAAVVTIQSTKIIRRPAMEDPWSRLMREQFGLGAPPRATRERQEALGSGFIVDRSGIVLTNNHVVAGADEVLVKLGDNRQFSAKVLGSDPATDVAVVKVDKPPHDLQAVTLGDSDKVRVGDYVLAIGNPLGLGQTVTMGIVSAKNRIIGEKLGPGALINVVGRGSPAEAAGLRSNDVIIELGGKSIDAYRRLTAAVAMLRPGEKVKVVFLRQGKRAEAVATLGVQGGAAAVGESTFLGVSLRQLESRDATSLGLPAGDGLQVTGVDPRGPASGVLEEGDVLLMLDGRPINLKRLKAVEDRLSRGQHAQLVIQRGPSRFVLRL